jgi:hypothetical protein
LSKLDAKCPISAETWWDKAKQLSVLTFGWDLFL